jgi:hypothetical protein
VRLSRTAPSVAFGTWDDRSAPADGGGWPMGVDAEFCNVHGRRGRPMGSTATLIASFRSRAARQVGPPHPSLFARLATTVTSPSGWMGFGTCI